MASLSIYSTKSVTAKSANLLTRGLSNVSRSSISIHVEFCLTNPNKWNERFFITFHDNPFVVPANIKTERAAMHAHIAHLFRDV